MYALQKGFVLLLCYKRYRTCHDYHSRYNLKKSVKEYSDAFKAQSIQDIIGRSGAKEYIEYLEKGLIMNCPIMKGDIL